MYINLLSNLSVITKPVAPSGPKLVTLIVYKTNAPFKTDPDTLDDLTILIFTVGTTVILVSLSILLLLLPVLFSVTSVRLATFTILPIPFKRTRISKTILSPLAKLPIFQTPVLAI
ncbi:hypothetical protein MBCUR_03090 [Methanobrevibacter curvatus]|uniref:Uncharacterized protein n=1 Tax=Methanobrevibacter curvatus TaxID=49547 RepID=A0A166D3B8_9EURY|nr:hypothetical protein MBCUR_03090 [Methanobrevibacter curvatus]